MGTKVFVDCLNWKLQGEKFENCYHLWEYEI